MINQREQDWRTPMEIVGSSLKKGNLQLQSVILLGKVISLPTRHISTGAPVSPEVMPRVNASAPMVYFAALLRISLDVFLRSQPNKFLSYPEPYGTLS